MSSDAAITLAVLVVMGIVLVIDRYSSIVVLGSAVAALLFAGVADSELALSGLSSSAPATVAALYVLAGAATATGVVGPVVDRLLGRRGSVFALAAGTATLSSVVPNTPLVAMFAPRVVRWCQLHGVSASRLLMPLSFASLLGGMVTMIGTSTNLVINDLVRQTGTEPFGLFDVTIVGLPVALAGVIVLSTVCPRLLPDRVPVGAAFDEGARSFQMTARVDAGGPLVGRSITEAGLRSLDGFFLAMIERGDANITAGPHTTLEAGDVCCFVGDVSRVLGLHDVAGLTSLENTHVMKTAGAGTEIFEAVISPGSEFVGSDLRSVDFRGRYGAAVLAIHRADEILPGQLGRIPLRAGDVLLVLAPSSFATTRRADANFSLVAAATEPPPVRRHRAWLVPLATIGMLVATVSGFTSLLEAALAAAIVTIVGGVIDGREAWNFVNLQVISMMALAISLGRIVDASGLGADIASLIDRVGGGRVVMVGAVMLMSIVLTEILTNAAAAALMVPIAFSLAASGGYDPKMLVTAVLIGASCSFLSPIGYQTNTMIWGLGGYRFTDFMRVGAPLTLCTIITGTAAISLAYA